MRARHEKLRRKAGIFPNCPKICILLSKKFPEHHSKLQLERANKVALDALNDQFEVHLLSMEPWIQGSCPKRLKIKSPVA
nr:protein NAP1 [Tanacetum cinerariifolium]